jgi:predicted DNA-binding transcriptional regulator YafY
LYWGAVWTLAAWCEMREDFRNLRLDRIAEAEITGESFTLQLGRTLDDFLAKVRGSAV